MLWRWRQRARIRPVVAGSAGGISRGGGIPADRSRKGSVLGSGSFPPSRWQQHRLIRAVGCRVLWRQQSGCRRPPFAESPRAAGQAGRRRRGGTSAAAGWYTALRVLVLGSGGGIVRALSGGLLPGRALVCGLWSADDAQVAHGGGGWEAGWGNWGVAGGGEVGAEGGAGLFYGAFAGV